MEDQSSEVQAPTTPSNSRTPSGQAQVVRMSLRPPSRFSAGADLVLWRKRFELYARQAKIAEDQWTGEVLPLLDDEPFRLVTQQGFDGSSEYSAVLKCLMDQYNPEGNDLEWQFKFQQRTQKPEERLPEYAGTLRALADKAYPNWPGEQLNELVRDQFIRGIRSSTVQLRLMRERPKTLNEALQLAGQYQGVEESQKRLHGASAKVETMAVGKEDDSESESEAVAAITNAIRPSRLATQVEQLGKQIETLKLQLAATNNGRTYPRSRPNDSVSRKRSDGVVCWYCGKRGHIKRNCAKLKTSVETAAVGSCLSVDGRLGKLVVKILIDTGSAVTLVREDVWKKVQQSPKTIKAPVHSVVAANGEKLELVGQGEVSITIGGVTRRHMVLVTKHLTQECILGVDFLIKHACVVDLRQHTFVIDGKIVQFNHTGVAEDVCFVSVSETVTVPACCQMYISASALDKKEAGAVLLEPLDTFMEDHGLLVARSLSQVSCNHLVVQVLNPGLAPVVVNKDVRVGVIKPVTDSDIVCSIESTKSNRHVGHSECAHLIELMLQNTEHLSSYHKSQGVALLQEFEDVIAKSDDDLGQTSLSFHTIDTGDNQPIRQHARRLPFHQHKEVSELVDSMLSRGIIESSDSPWASPVVLVRKKDGKTRFCVDFRKLNDCTRKDAQPLPRIDESLDALGGACFFSTLDLASGYWQVMMDPKSKEKTAFTTPYGLYQFRVMPFGLCNAPATFQRLMERVLSGLHWTACLVYLDDIIIFSKTVEQHLALLRDVLSRLRRAGLKVKPSKCHLLQTSVHYLGHVVSAKGIETDPGKVKCVSNWPIPTTSKELSSFLGLASYYRRFIKNFAHVAAPLHVLIHKGKPWQWTTECTEAFFELKKMLISAPVLTLPDFSKSFVLDTDASGEGLGAVLSQTINGMEHVIAYASRTLTHTEKR